MSTDVDDVVAICMANELTRRGEANLIGIVHDTGLLEGVGAVSVINHFYGNDEIALGAFMGTFDNGSEILANGNWQSTGGVDEGQSTARTTEGPYVKNLVRDFPSPVKNYSQVPDAVSVYRNLLASQPDHSVVLASIGFLTNLENLLRSRPDEISSLSGVELVSAKVKRIVVMGGSYPNSSHLFGSVEHEWNFGGGCNWSAPVCPTTRQATAYFLEHWPADVPIVFLGFEVGVKILRRAIGCAKLELAAVAPEQPPNPCAAAFKDYREWNAEFWPQRPSWDPAAVLVAVRGVDPFFEVHAVGRNTVSSADGSNMWVADPPAGGHGQQSYLRFADEATGPSALGRAIDELVCVPRGSEVAPRATGVAGGRLAVDELLPMAVSSTCRVVWTPPLEPRRGPSGLWPKRGHAVEEQPSADKYSIRYRCMTDIF
eukprot:CAMPEP_0115177432 /NCGR_PEP_ID=MMETSP0270-20121206/5379_1 /TAXON_ID=71861 /ORGANISM="Scrippsiella trochoidea, Strain CCMP3099" /LENGTH=428 /DNA_ID=CAMNT_0002590357 /DNA_START=33 /DNA_END=1321 /DNA_ORIENTATION=-